MSDESRIDATEIEDAFDLIAAYATAKQERDEAQAEVERIRKSRAYIAEKYEQAESERDVAEAERDAAREQVAALQDALRKLATYAKPVVDRLWESGESQPAEVIRLGEATQEALALVEDT